LSKGIVFFHFYAHDKKQANKEKKLEDGFQKGKDAFEVNQNGGLLLSFTISY
jgi:hypothetical protein